MLYEYLKETEGYEIVVNVPDKILVRADKNKMNQVIYNLINNGLNYTGDDKIVKLNITEHKKEYLVEIIDSGKGIDPKDIDHIWDISVSIVSSLQTSRPQVAEDAAEAFIRRRRTGYIFPVFCIPRYRLPIRPPLRLPPRLRFAKRSRRQQKNTP